MNANWKNNPPDPHGDPEERLRFGRELAIDSLLRALGEADRLPQSGGELLAKRPAKPRPHMIVFLMAMACALAITLSFFLVLQASRTMTVLTLEGRAHKVDRHGRNVALVAGVAVRPGEDLVTMDASALKLGFHDGTQIRLGENATLKNLRGKRADRSKMLLLEKGLLSADVAPQPLNRPLRIDTPYARARVIGTRFQLAICTDHSELNVTEGKVGFSRQQDECDWLIHDGQIAGLGPRTEWIEEADPTDPVITGFSLIDASTGQPVPGFELLQDQQLIPLAKLPEFGVNIRILTSGRVSCVQVQSNQNERLEKYPPFSVAGDQLHHGRGYNRMDLSEQVYRITATPQTRESLNGNTRSLTLRFQ